MINEYFEFVPGYNFIYYMLVAFHNYEPHMAMHAVYDDTYEELDEQFGIDKYLKAAVKALNENYTVVRDLDMEYFFEDKDENMDYFFMLKNDIYTSNTIYELLDKGLELMEAGIYKALKAFHNDFVMKEETVFPKKKFEELSKEELASELLVLNPILIALNSNKGELEEKVNGKFIIDEKFYKFIKNYKEDEVYEDIVDDGTYLDKKEMTKKEALAYGLEFNEENGSITITNYNGKDNTLVIPYSIDGKKVVKVNGIYVKNFTELVIYAKLEEINSGSFSSTPIQKVSVYGALGLVDNGCFTSTKLKQTSRNGVIYLEMNNNPFYHVLMTSRSVASHIIINENNKSIAGRAFYNTNCQYIVCKSTEYIGKYAFARMENLKGIKLGDNLKAMGEYTLYQCNKIESLYLNVKRIPDFCLFFCEHLSNLSLGNRVEIIGVGAFGECDKLSELTIPSSVNVIEEDAFDSSDIKTIVFEEISNWKIVDNNQKIDSGNFVDPYSAKRTLFKYDEYRLEKESVSIKTEITMEEMEESIGDSYADDNDNTIGIFDSKKGLKEIVVPKKIDKYEVSYIGFNFGSDTETLESVKVYGHPETDNCLFSNNPNLKNVYIDELMFFGSGSFGDCDKITTIYEGVRYVAANGNPYYLVLGLEDENQEYVRLHRDAVCIRDQAFEYTNIKEIALNDLKVIGKNAFYSCEQLTEVYIPKSVEKIGESAFENCIELKTVVIEKRKELAKSMFNGCTSLENVDLPEGLEKLNEFVFMECKSLKNMFIPDSVEVIEPLAFAYCNSLDALVMSSDNWYCTNEAGDAVQYFSDKGTYLDWLTKPSVAAYRFRARTEYFCRKYKGTREEFKELQERTKVKGKAIDMSFYFKLYDSDLTCTALEKYKLW